MSLVIAQPQSAMRENNFMIGNVDLVGVCDIVKCKCDKNYDVMAHNVKGRTHFCFYQFSAGKCVDPLGRLCFHSSMDRKQAWIPRNV